MKNTYKYWKEKNGITSIFVSEDRAFTVWIKETNPTPEQIKLSRPKGVREFKIK